MIRIQETENEYLLYIPAAQRHRAKKIRPREWDWQRICWVYPRSGHIFKSLMEEFGSDSTAEISIGIPQSSDEQRRDVEKNSEIQSLRGRLAQLQARIEFLTDSDNRSTANWKRTVSEMAERLQRVERDYAKMTEQNKQLRADKRKLTDEVKNSAADREQALGDMAVSLQRKDQEFANLTKQNRQTRAENRKLTDEIKDSAADREQAFGDMADSLHRKEQEIDKLTKQNAGLKARSRKLSDRIREIEKSGKETMPLRGRNESTDPANRPNRSVLSDAIDIFRDTMRPFVIRSLKQVPGCTVEEVIRRSVPSHQADEFDQNLRRHSDLASAIDVNYFPRLVQHNWRDAFSISFQGRETIKNELWMIAEARNEVSHPPVGDFGPDFTGAHLYHIAEVLGRINAPEQKEKVKEMRLDWSKGFG